MNGTGDERFDKIQELRKKKTFITCCIFKCHVLNTNEKVAIEKDIITFMTIHLHSIHRNIKSFLLAVSFL